MASMMRGLVSKKKIRFQEEGFDLDLTYVTERIIACGFPSTGKDAIYRNPLPEMQRFVAHFHPGKLKIYNLCSEREYPKGTFEHMARFPFDDHNPPPLTLFAPFCKDVDEWMAADPENVIAVHCKAGKGRTGTFIAAYLVHSGHSEDATSAIQFFGNVRTANGKGITIPSQMRYVHYYEQELKGGVRPVFSYKVNHIRMNTIPSFDPAMLGRGGCDPYFQIKVNGKKVYDYRKHVKKVEAAKGSLAHFDFDVREHNIVVRENVKFMFFDWDRGSADDKMFHFWFHTGYVDSNYLCFEKAFIDKACKDKKAKIFKADFSVEIFMTKMEGSEVTFLGGEDDEPADTDTEEEKDGDE